MMNNSTKITLSAKELELVCNTEWILTKHKIIQKVYHLFGESAATMQLQLEATQPGLASITSPKISKGENYRLLPYVILDYPRVFSKADTAAIRTLFWWGNFCSVNLQLSGSYKANATKKLQANYANFCAGDYWICIAETEWEHDFKEDNFVAVSSISNEEFTNLVKQKLFVKIAKKIPLTEWDNMHDFIVKTFKQLQAFL